MTGCSAGSRSSPMRISFRSRATSPILRPRLQRSAAVQDAAGIRRRRQEASQRDHLQLVGTLRRAPHSDRSLFTNAAGVKLRHLPTQGGGPALTALLGNNSQVLVSSVSACLSQVKAGKARPLRLVRRPALEGAAGRSDHEGAGYDVEYYLWVGTFAPEGTPANVIDLSARGLEQGGQQRTVQGRRSPIWAGTGLHGSAGIRGFLGGRYQAHRSGDPLDRQESRLKPDRATNCANHLRGIARPSPLTTPSRAMRGEGKDSA